MVLEASDSTAVMLSRFLTDWLPDPSKLAILCGAGVSMDPPTALPSGGDLMKALVGTVVDDPELSNTVLHLTDPVRADRQRPEDYLRLERVLQILHDFDPDAIRILNYFADYFPANANHYSLAISAQVGCILLTTNFDYEIELAADDLGIRLQRLFLPEHFTAWNRGHPTLAKLHGDALHDADSPPVAQRSTVATLLDLYREGRALEASPKWQTVQSILQERDLLVLGYSGADDVDLGPLLCTTTSQRRVLWVQHSATFRKWLKEDVARQPRDGVGEIRAPHVRTVSSLMQRRQEEDVTLIEAPTAMILAHLGEKWRLSPSIRPLADKAHARVEGFLSSQSMWQEISRQKLAARSFTCLRRLSAEGSLIAAGLLLSIGRFAEANCALTPRLRTESSTEESVLSLLAAFRLLMSYGQVVSARQFVEKADEILPKNRSDLAAMVDRAKKSLTHGSSYGAWAKTKAYQPDKTTYTPGAPEHSADHPAATYNSRGEELRTVGRHREARVEFAKALEICRSIGDETGAAVVNSNIALTHAGEGNWSTSVEMFRAIKGFYEEHGLLQEASFALSQLATVLLESGDFQSAKSHFEELVSYAGLSRSSYDLAYAFHGLGRVAFFEGDIKQAIVAYLKARHFYEATGNSFSRFNSDFDFELLVSSIPPAELDKLRARAAAEIEAL